jgi:hypothetical protein
MAGNQGSKEGERVSIESKIKSALEPLKYKVYPNTYSGPGTTPYFVFNFDTIPDDFGNNKPKHERALVQVHLFCPHEFDSVTLRKNVKKNLSKAGFTWPVTTNASDENGQHYVFECQIAEGTDG